MHRTDKIGKDGKIIYEDMNSRQWCLYSYLVRGFDKDPDEWLCPKKIAEQVNFTLAQRGHSPEEEGYRLSSEKAHDPCPKIWADMRDINNDDTPDRVIIMSQVRYKIGTKKETEDYIARSSIKAKKVLGRNGMMFAKVNRDGQGKLLFGESLHDAFGKFVKGAE